MAADAGRYWHSQGSVEEARVATTAPRGFRQGMGGCIEICRWRCMSGRAWGAARCREVPEWRGAHCLHGTEYGVLRRLHTYVEPGSDGPVFLAVESSGACSAGAMYKYFCQFVSND